MEFKFKIGEINDFEQLKNLSILSYSEFAKDLDLEHWQKLNSFLHDEVALKELIAKSMVIVCETTEIVGMAFLLGSGNATSIFSNDAAYIRMVGVHPAYRGNGIAKLLTQHCIEEARKNGESTLELHTSEFMEAARHIYERLGFKQVKELSPIFGKRYWLYELKL